MINKTSTLQRQLFYGPPQPSSVGETQKNTITAQSSHLKNSQIVQPRRKSVLDQQKSYDLRHKIEQIEHISSKAKKNTPGFLNSERSNQVHPHSSNSPAYNSKDKPVRIVFPNQLPNQAFEGKQQQSCNLQASTSLIQQVQQHKSPLSPQHPVDRKRVSILQYSQSHKKPQSNHFVSINEKRRVQVERQVIMPGRNGTSTEVPSRLSNPLPYKVQNSSYSHVLQDNQKLQQPVKSPNQSQRKVRPRVPSDQGLQNQRNSEWSQTSGKRHQTTMIQEKLKVLAQFQNRNNSTLPYCYSLHDRSNRAANQPKDTVYSHEAIAQMLAMNYALPTLENVSTSSSSNVKNNQRSKMFSSPTMQEFICPFVIPTEIPCHSKAQSICLKQQHPGNRSEFIKQQQLVQSPGVKANKKFNLSMAKNQTILTSHQAPNSIYDLNQFIKVQQEVSATEMPATHQDNLQFRTQGTIERARDASIKKHDSTKVVQQTKTVDKAQTGAHLSIDYNKLEPEYYARQVSAQVKNFQKDNETSQTVEDEQDSFALKLIASKESEAKQKLRAQTFDSKLINHSIKDLQETQPFINSGMAQQTYDTDNLASESRQDNCNLPEITKKCVTLKQVAEKPNRRSKYFVNSQLDSSSKAFFEEQVQTQAKSHKKSRKQLHLTKSSKSIKKRKSSGVIIRKSVKLLSNQDMQQNYQIKLSKDQINFVKGAQSQEKYGLITPDQDQAIRSLKAPLGGSQKVSIKELPEQKTGGSLMNLLSSLNSKQMITQESQQNTKSICSKGAASSNQESSKLSNIKVQQVISKGPRKNSKQPNKRQSSALSSDQVCKTKTQLSRKQVSSLSVISKDRKTSVEEIPNKKSSTSLVVKIQTSEIATSRQVGSKSQALFDQKEIPTENSLSLHMKGPSVQSRNLEYQINDLSKESKQQSQQIDVAPSKDLLLEDSEQQSDQFLQGFKHMKTNPVILNENQLDISHQSSISFTEKDNLKSEAHFHDETKEQPAEPVVTETKNFEVLLEMKPVIKYGQICKPSRINQYDEEYTPNPKTSPFVTCKSYAIIDALKGKVLFQKQAQEIREMASLTKIMTALVSLHLIKELKLDFKKVFFTVSQKASQTIGTTGNLVEGQRLSIQDLLYALMLPSGNDAAVTLGENFGDRLSKAKKFKRQALHDKAAGKQQTHTTNLHLFIKEMNKMAKHLRLKNTNYTNPHGLADKANHSSALELAQLCCSAMKNPEFARIVNTKEWSTTTYMPKQSFLKTNYGQSMQGKLPEGGKMPFDHPEKACYISVPTVWFNSNKLLGLAGFSGVKTGITNTAGSCLSVYYTNKKSNQKLITIVLGSRNIEYRWKDTRRLTLWADAVLYQDWHTRMYPQKKTKPNPDRFS